MNARAPRLRFGDFELDPGSATLFRGSRRVRIQPQPLRVLAILVDRAGEVVSREELRDAVWDQATFVEFDQGLNYCIRQIIAGRTVLDYNVSADGSQGSQSRSLSVVDASAIETLLSRLSHKSSPVLEV